MRRLLPLLAAALTLAAALAWADRLRLQAFDDAYITFRAAVNLAHGQGPVFNPGERVESATSPLWVAVLALAERLGAGPVAASNLLTLLFAAGAAAAAALCALQLGGPLAAAIAAISLALLPAWSCWICTGMEIPLAGLCIAAALLLALRERAAAAGLLFAAAAMSRPESLLLGPAFLFALPRARWPRFLLAALAPLAALLLARRAYFGEWTPNTYVAKRAGLGLQGLIRGLEYVAAFAMAYAALVVAVVVAAVRGRGPRRALAMACIGFAAAVAWDGGDHFPLSRLLSPILPIGCAVLGVELSLLPRRWVPAGLAAAVAVTLGLPKLARVPGPASKVAEMEVEAAITAQVREGSLALQAMPPGRLATVAIGIIGFETRWPILDLVGLADAHIARTPHLAGVAPGHDHADVDYVLAQKPDYALFVPQLAGSPMTLEQESARLRRVDHYLRAARLLQGDPRFRAAYEAVDVRSDGGQHLRLWRLRR